MKVNKWHDKAVAESGVCIVPYDLRHTFATDLADANVPLHIIAAILGHANLRSVQRYVHPTPEGQKKAMALFEAAMGQQKQARPM